MMRKNVLLCAAVALFWCISGCSKSMAPDCNADKTKAEVLKKVFADTMNKGYQKRENRNYFGEDDLKGNSGQFKFANGQTAKYQYSDGVLKFYADDGGLTNTIENIRTVSINKDTGKCECAADIKTEVVDKKQSKPATIMSITYSSELADNGKKHFVDFKIAAVKDITADSLLTAKDKSPSDTLKEAVQDVASELDNSIKTAQRVEDAISAIINNPKFKDKRSPCSNVSVPLYQYAPPAFGIVSLQAEGNSTIKIEARGCDGANLAMKKIFRD